MIMMKARMIIDWLMGGEPVSPPEGGRRGMEIPVANYSIPSQWLSGRPHCDDSDGEERRGGQPEAPACPGETWGKPNPSDCPIHPFQGETGGS